MEVFFFSRERKCAIAPWARADGWLIFLLFLTAGDLILCFDIADGSAWGDAWLFL